MNILHDSQHGFRRQRSRDTQLVYAHNKLASSFNKNIVNDVSNANHRKLLFEFVHYGLHKQFGGSHLICLVNGADPSFCLVISGVL